MFRVRLPNVEFELLITSGQITIVSQWSRSEHTGKTPEVLRQSRDNAERLKSLNKKLTKAIASEDFEQAAKLRDELKHLNERPPSPTKTDAIKI